ncbi:hypothetical protein A3K86_14605 [Photobacterium jeanii]|uniref:DUF218 domain-containing protein n=1 Tax=Photobacterium jeanii TaxID=858640 RepID=A0A178K8X8_9GAMM|nr:hypothetical protein [Photobacterium jeanii]OAN13788.1 hypothetical protein A3K86_14605 [Photobacterium jeanii]PST92751.1 hypothetical protein C9I91_06195 [Photobacterium jeanii]
MTAPHIVEFHSEFPHRVIIGDDTLTLQASEQLDVSFASRSYVLPRTSALRVKDYLAQASLFLEPYGDVQQADAVLAFSFGDAPSVNRELQHVAQQCAAQKPNMPVLMQQEIFAHAQAANNPVFSIAAQQYQTTTDVARSAMMMTDKRKVIVVAQAWHAQRCIATCEALGWQVVGLRCVAGFPEDDPQPWVRHPLNWIIKESHREQAAGYEISELFQLI